VESQKSQPQVDSRTYRQPTGIIARNCAAVSDIQVRKDVVDALGMFREAREVEGIAEDGVNSCRSFDERNLYVSARIAQGGSTI
jgi:hypothetical protein